MIFYVLMRFDEHGEPLLVSNYSETRTRKPRVRFYDDLGQARRQKTILLKEAFAAKIFEVVYNHPHLEGVPGDTLLGAEVQ